MATESSLSRMEECPKLTIIWKLDLVLEDGGLTAHLKHWETSSLKETLGLNERSESQAMEDGWDHQWGPSLAWVEDDVVAVTGAGQGLEVSDDIAEVEGEGNLVSILDHQMSTHNHPE